MRRLWHSTRTFICNSSPRDVSTESSLVFVTVKNKPGAAHSVSMPRQRLV